MSGHSKWAQIKRQKAAADKKKGQIFSKLARAIAVAVREGGGGDPAANFKLRVAIDKAHAAAMPNQNIERAIERGLGVTGEGHLEEIIYEGFGPFGSAFLIETATDNRNRTVSELKHILAKYGGSLGGSGNVAWQFATRGQILVERSQNDMSDLELAAIDAGAEDVRSSPEGLEIYTEPLELGAIKEKLQSLGAKIAQAEIIKESTQGLALNDEQKSRINELLAELEDQEDVIAVHTNANL